MEDLLNCFYRTNAQDMKLRGFLLLSIFLPLFLMGQKEEQLRAFRLVDDSGKELAFQTLLERGSEADFVFFGEQHDDPIGHWLQLRLTRALYEKKGDSLQLGAEMFEAPDQLILNEYLEGRIRMKDLKRTAKLWDNFNTDYRPLLEFARKNEIPFLASNVPRRYAALLHRNGRSALDSLNQEAYRYMAEDFVFDTSLASYQRIMGMGHGSKGRRIAEAQALKDATMAERIASSYEEGECFLHFNGTFHSDAHEGIVHYLKKELPDAQILVISTQKVEEMEGVEGKDLSRKGDVNLLVPEDMTSTH